MGKLPEDPKYSVVLNELFGNQALLTFPSRRPGMQYSKCTLATLRTTCCMLIE
jgi:hypothetical protein